MESHLEKSVPLTMGSPRSFAVNIGPFIVTEAWFPPHLVLPPHLHDRTTFGVMLDGSFDLRFGVKTYDCPPASVFTEPLGEKHGNRVGSKGAKVLVLQPDHEQEALFEPCRKLFDEMAHFRHAGIRGLAYRMSYELRASDPTSAMAMQALGFEMLTVATRIEVPSRSAPPAWLLRAEEMLREECLKQINLQDVAAAVGVHPAHLARAFRTHYRESVGKFVQRLRIDWAIARLASTVDRIVDITLAAGFSDQSHFTRAFKSHTGLTPAAYRRVVRD